MLYIGILFMVEIREVSFGMSLNILKYLVMKDCTTFSFSVSRAFKFVNNVLYSGWLYVF